MSDNFFSRSPPCKSLATIFPSGPTIKFWGIASTWYDLATAFLRSPVKSQTCAQDKPSSRMALGQASLVEATSMDTPRILNPLSLYAWYAFTTFGLSARQGPHQLAQKSTITYLPRKSCRDTGRPAVSGSVKSGAMAPTEIDRSRSRSAAYWIPRG